MKKRNRNYTPGMEDIERTFDVLEEQRKKEARKEWLRKHQDEKKPKGGELKDEKNDSSDNHGNSSN